MKKILSILIAAVIGLTSTLAVSLSVFADDDVSMTQEEFIEKADEFVKVTDDGLIELELPDDLIDELSPEEYEQMMAGITAINDAVESGDLSVTPNGTIYETDDDELVVQGGNVDKLTWNWWGIRRYANHNNAKYISDLCAETAETFSYVGAGSLFVGICCSGIPYAGEIIDCFGACSMITSTYFSGFGRNINFYNGDSGVIIDFTWILAYQVQSQ